MDGILVQTTRSLRTLIDNATAGAPAREIGLAYHALLDQCGAAEREALRRPADPVARFDARAAAVLSVAYRPVLDVLSSGRSLRSDDVELAQKSSGWLNLAYEALLDGDHDTVERCLRMASAFAGAGEDSHDPAPPA